VGEFNDGEILLDVSFFYLCFGLTEVYPKPNNERFFLVPRGKAAERILVKFAKINMNALEKRANDKGEEVISIRYRGKFKELVKILRGEGSPCSCYGSGVPSLDVLCSEVSGATAH
jgi:hypothetical protein